MNSLLTPLISSGVRAKLLLRLFANPGQSAYLRGLASDFKVSPNAVREELLRLSQAKLLTAQKQGREVHYRANGLHPLFAELVSMAQKAMGIDQIIESIRPQLGCLELAMVVGDYAVGQDSGLVDLVLVGQVDRCSLDEVVCRTEHHLGRKIRTQVFSPDEFRDIKPILMKKQHIILWQDGSQLEGNNLLAATPRPVAAAESKTEKK